MLDLQNPGLTAYEQLPARQILPRNICGTFTILSSSAASAASGFALRAHWAIFDLTRLQTRVVPLLLHINDTMLLTSAIA